MNIYSSVVTRTPVALKAPWRRDWRVPHPLELDFYCQSSSERSTADFENEVLSFRRCLPKEVADEDECLAGDTTFMGP